MEAYHPSMFGCSTSSSSSPSSYLTLMNTMMNNNNTTNMENNGLLKMSENMMKSNELKNGFVGDGTESEARPGKNKKEDDDQQKKKKIKKGRFAFQTRSQVDILDDGYRWRKYGQKAVKNNRFPRSYYRCTYQGCNVKKQVQRLSKDEGVVVTTYEGVHSHPIEKSTENFENILTQMHIYAAI